MFEIDYLLNKIIIPTNERLGIPRCDKLMLGTAAQESRLGLYLKQFNYGPALGVWQVEPDTHDLVINWFKDNHIDLYEIVRDIKNEYWMPNPIVSNNSDLVALEHNHCYNYAISRCLYYSIQDPLPDDNDVNAMAEYWKQYYNRYGKGTVEEFVKNYNELVASYYDN